MSEKKYVITLTNKERKDLNNILKNGKSLHKQKWAQSLLLSENKNTDVKISKITNLTPCSLYRLRKSFSEKRMDIFSEHHSIKDETQLIALAKSRRPEGYIRWTTRLLTETWNASLNNNQKSISRETVQKILRKHNIKLGRKYNKKHI